MRAALIPEMEFVCAGTTPDDTPRLDQLKENSDSRSLVTTRNRIFPCALVMLVPLECNVGTSRHASLGSCCRPSQPVDVAWCILSLIVLAIR